MDRHAAFTDEQCDMCCCSDFLNLPAPEVDPSWSFNLTNPILPLFAQSKFEHGRPGSFEPLPLARYEKLAPALRLASRMLTDDCSCHFICTMRDGTLHDDLEVGAPALDWQTIDAAEPPWHETENPSRPKVQLIRRPQEATMPADAMRSRAIEILDNLAGVMNLIGLMEGVEKVSLGETGQFPSTHRLGKLDGHTQKYFPRTVGMFMIFNVSSAKIDMDEPSSLSQYLFARLLVHEVAHVLQRAIHGFRLHETYYQDSWTNEAGFELEKALFSGTCEHWPVPDIGESYDQQGSVIITEHWPSIRLFKQYGDKAYNFARRGEPDKYLTISRLDPAFLAQLCDDTFWNERQDLALSSSTLLTRPILPTNLNFWVVGVREDNVNVNFDSISDRDLPLELIQFFRQTWQKKLDRLAIEEPAVAEDEETVQAPEEKVEAQRSPKHAGDWREQ